MRSIVKPLIIVCTCLFSLAFGLLFVQFLIPAYFKIFPPASKTLSNFCMGMGIFSFALLVLDVILFKMGKYIWGILILGTAVLFLGFGIPIIMFENNNMLWLQAVLFKRGPVYFIEFSEAEIKSLEYIYNLYTLIWNKVYPFVYSYSLIFIACYIYLWKKGWRIKGMRIKF